MEESLTKKGNWTWLMVALLAQTAWGAYPVMARYLQTVSQLPSLSILALGSLVALLAVSILFLPRIKISDFKSKRLLVFALIVLARGVTNLFAARFTLAIYVQLITMLTPFLVALLSTMVWHERLPRYTGRALILGLTGVLLIIGVDFLGSQAASPANRTDWLGISLATGGSLLLALYMIAVRRSTFHNIRGEALLLVQLVSLALGGFLLSLLLGESWQQWRTIDAFDWFIFGLLAVGVLAGANIGQISSIRHLGAALVSSIMPWRLVSVLAVSAVLLDERLTSIWQFAGVILVITTVSWYLWQQRE
ncbi:MAG: DMT family transporter [Candidatus Promineifilaceae bacterium]